jgi:osmotically-inducible protein OsmY
MKRWGEDMKTDAELEGDVAAELEWAGFDRSSVIRVSVTHGVVLLSGVVDDHTQKYAAAEAVERVGGVRAIRNAIAVRRRDTVEQAAHALPTMVDAPAPAPTPPH